MNQETSSLQAHQEVKVVWLIQFTFIASVGSSDGVHGSVQIVGAGQGGQLIQLSQTHIMILYLIPQQYNLTAVMQPQHCYQSPGPWHLTSYQRYLAETQLLSLHYFPPILSHTSCLPLLHTHRSASCLSTSSHQLSNVSVYKTEEWEFETISAVSGIADHRSLYTQNNSALRNSSHSAVLNSGARATMDAASSCQQEKIIESFNRPNGA